MKTVFLFGGQGSQFFGMARPLFDKNAAFREALYDLDAMAKRIAGRSILDAVYDPQRTVSDPFDRTPLTHPAIFMVEMALARALEHEGVVPDVALGSSLGELAAMVVAGMLTTEDALEACILQGEVLDARCAPGGMIAILDDPRIFDDRAWMREDCTIAGVNLARHFVVSAKAARCDAIVDRCDAEQVLCQRLPVRVAFHSREMDVAKDEFLARVAKTPFAAPKIPVLSCARAATLDRASPEYLWELARAPMRLRETLALTAKLGPCRFVDLTPGSTLSTFVKHHFMPEKPANHPIITGFRNDLDNLARAVAECRRPI